jgi:hypothetical protein
MLFKEITKIRRLINTILFFLPFLEKKIKMLNKNPCIALMIKKRLKKSFVAIY